MAHVPEVLSIEWVRLNDPEGGRAFVHAVGRVDTDGWSALRLRPRFSAQPPADGFWEFDFEGDPPFSPRLRLPITVSAEATVAAPDWLRGIRVYGRLSRLSSAACTEVRMAGSEGNAAGLSSAEVEARSHSLLACYFDQVAPLDRREFDGAARTRARRHELTLTICGRDAARIQRCLARLGGLGLFDTAAAVHARSGGKLFAAAAAILAHIRDELGPSYPCRIDDLSSWVEWRP